MQPHEHWQSDRRDSFHVNPSSVTPGASPIPRVGAARRQTTTYLEMHIYYLDTIPWPWPLTTT
jgi:hypothetical protein